MDFDWPLGQVWHGYVNPWPGPVICGQCLGTGLSAEGKRLYDSFRSWSFRMTDVEATLLRAGGVSARDVTRLRNRNWTADTPSVRILLVEIRTKRKGTWKACDTCAGSLMVPNPNPAVQQLYEGVDLYEEWTPIEPPKGDGWQLWTGEAPDGRPYSPVFSSCEDLAKWCSKKFKTAYQDWLVWAQRECFITDEPKDPVFQLKSDSLRVYMAPPTPTKRT